MRIIKLINLIRSFYFNQYPIIIPSTPIAHLTSELSDGSKTIIPIAKKPKTDVIHIWAFSLSFLSSSLDTNVY